MDYLRIGRATDIKDIKERKVFRRFEIFPGALSWFTLIGAVILSWLAPFFVFYFLIIFVSFWLIRSVYFMFYLHSGFRKMQKHKDVDWISKLENLSHSDYSLAINKWQDVYQLILLPNYKEQFEVIADSLESLIESDYPKDKMIVVLSFEQRAGIERNIVAEKIKKRFGTKFFRLLITFHPSDLPNEIAGHGANDAWAARQAKELIIDPLGIDHKSVLVSSFDIDTRVFPKYFSCLTYHYLTTKSPTRTSFQPIPLYNNNFWEAPPFSQISAFTATFWQIMCQERPNNLVSFSSHSMSFKALVEVGFKQENIIPDDSRIFWQCFFKYDGDYRVEPIFYPVSMDANIGENLLETLKNIYKQKKRWAYGVEDIPYFLYACRKNKKVPFRKKFLRGLELIVGHWSWSTASILIFALGWLPIFLGGANFSYSLMAYTVPRTMSRLLTFAMLGLVSSIWVSYLLLPSAPKKHGKRKYLIFFLSWFLISIEMIVLNALPALEAQTRCMLGRYMEFWVTPKKRKKRLEG